ncbi:MAG TPA: hypothetical protein VK914_07970 [bacterium]|jgi:hypothetical protein|nr:hypothetical protein [bacterium]
MKNYFPAVEDVYNLELRTLSFLGKSSRIRDISPEFMRSADQASSILRGRKKSILNSHSKDEIQMIDFEASFDSTSVRGKTYHVHLGADVRVRASKFSQVSYFIAVAENGKLFRKVHFDLAQEPGARAPLKPSSHFQIGGELSTTLRSQYSESEYSKLLQPDLSEPRVFFFPVSLAFSFLILVRDFRVSDFAALSGDEEFRKLMLTCEEKMLTKFVTELKSKLNDKTDSIFLTHYHDYD